MSGTPGRRPNCNTKRLRRVLGNDTNASTSKPKRPVLNVQSFCVDDPGCVASRVSVLLLLLALGGLPVVNSPATAQGQDTTQTRERERREVSSFSKVGYAVPGILHLREAEETRVEVVAPPDVLRQIRTTVEGRTLRIHSENASDGDGTANGPLWPIFSSGNGECS